MPAVTIFYFSGTGNTWWVSKEIINKLNAQSQKATAISIENISADEADLQLAKSDIAGFGYPIYGSDLPQIMKDFIKRLRQVQAKPIFVFCTQWIWSGDGARVGASFLKPKGFDIKWGEHFLMPNNICLPIPLLPFTNDKSRMQGQLKRANQRIEKFVAAIVSGEKRLRGFNYFSQMLGSLQRVPVRKVFSSMQENIGCEENRCIRCELCKYYCPVGNIRFEAKHFLTKGNCIMCMRCYNFCPQSAITFWGKKHNCKKGEPFRGPVQDFKPKK